MLDFTIRTATPEDAQGIAEAHVKTWQCAYKGQIPDSFLDSLSVESRAQVWKEILTTSQKGTFAYVAEFEGKIIGWCTTGTNRDEDAAEGAGELYGIYVDPEYIGKGVGSQLMERATRALKAEGYKKATLWVLDSNVKTRAFYEKNGWVVEGGVKDDPREGFVLHEVRYVCSLEGGLN